ncbi:MAG: carbonic anhydrase [Candidatus Aceula meridiana]|nr:carbonic anhydrase [Candidatus Aceula meridiana]
MTSLDKNNNFDTRATCLNCMDGRVQLPVLYWIREKYHIDFVDVITEAGIDKIIALQENIDEIIRSIEISVNTNKSSRIFVVGHYDCKGNSVDKKTHHEHILKSVKRLKTLWSEFEIIGLWVNSHWQVEVCCK